MVDSQKEKMYGEKENLTLTTKAVLRYFKGFAGMIDVEKQMKLFIFEYLYMKCYLYELIHNFWDPFAGRFYCPKVPNFSSKYN